MSVGELACVRFQGEVVLLLCGLWKKCWVKGSASERGEMGSGGAERKKRGFPDRESNPGRGGESAES